MEGLVKQDGSKVKPNYALKPILNIYNAIGLHFFFLLSTKEAHLPEFKSVRSAFNIWDKIKHKTNQIMPNMSFYPLVTKLAIIISIHCILLFRHGGPHSNGSLWQTMPKTMIIIWKMGTHFSIPVSDKADHSIGCPTLLPIIRLLIFLFSNSEEKEPPIQRHDHCKSQFVLDRRKIVVFCFFFEVLSAPKLFYLL